MLAIGHRGAAGYEPENTLCSFEKAVELGADMVELDVRRCKSGELVVIHDEKVDRTTNSRGLVVDMTLTELKKFDVGKGQAIPTLEEVLDLVDKRVGVNIELKGKKVAKVVANTVRHYLSRGWDQTLFIVSSFDHEELKKFRQYSPKTRIGVLFDKKPGDLIDFAKAISAYSIHVPAREATNDLISVVKQNGFKIFVWTLNDKTDIRRMRKIGVDGVFSDFPDRLILNEV